jgi:hypothetical protein
MTNDSIEDAGLSKAEKSRREFIQTAGKLAIYTPPALMILMRPKPDAIAASAGQTQYTDGNTDKECNGILESTPEEDTSQPRFWLWR